MNVEALKQMIRVLQEVDKVAYTPNDVEARSLYDGEEPIFYLAGWARRNSPESASIKEAAECGFAGCACGWAAQDAWFNAQGFKLAGLFREPAFGDLTSWEAVKAFFDLNDNEVEFLFSVHYYAGDEKDITTTRVIEHTQWLLDGKPYNTHPDFIAVT